MTSSSSAAAEPAPETGIEESARRPAPGRRLAAAALRWALRQRLVQVFVADRPLAIATGVCALVCLVPLFVTTFLPLVDLGSNVGAATLLDDVAFGHGIVAARYRVNWLPVPYWSGWAVMCLISTVSGAFFAAKATVALGVLLVPLATMRLLQALGRSPRLGLLAFLLAWDTNLYWGWVTFQIGVPCALWLLAVLIETDSWRGAARLIPWSAFVALTHLHAVALLGLGALFQALVRPRRGRAVGQAALALTGFLVLIPWLISQLHGWRSGGGGSLEMAFDPLPDRLRQLHRFTLDVFTSSGGSKVAALAFLLFIVGPAALGALRPVATPPRSGAIALALVAAPLLLFLTLPFAVEGPIVHWWTYPRYGTYVLLGLLLLPAPDLRGRRALALAPGLALFAALTIARVDQFAAYDRETRPYLKIIAAMKRNTSFLPLDLDTSWTAGMREQSLGQLHGYAAAARASYDPHLFDNPNAPLVFRTDGQPPQPNWRGLHESFSFEWIGRYYDYIIVHPIARDPLERYVGSGVEWVRDSGAWRLYHVVDKQ